MTRKNYGPIVATSLRLITKFGRDVSFIQYGETPEDSSKPWDGPDPDADPAEFDPVTLQAVVVPPAKIRKFGITTLATGVDWDGLVQQMEDVMIVAPEGHDMKKFSAVSYGGEEYGIIATAILQPAETPIIAYVGVRR